MTNKEIAEAYLNAFNTKDHATMRSLVHDDFSFHGPLMQHDSADSFFAAMQGMGDMFAGLQLHGTAQDGDWVGSYYIFKSTVPGLEETHTSEWFNIIDGKIKTSYVVYDATKWREVMAQMEQPA